MSSDFGERQKRMFYVLIYYCSTTVHCSATALPLLYHYSSATTTATTNATTTLLLIKKWKHERRFKLPKSSHSHITTQFCPLTLYSDILVLLSTLLMRSRAARTQTMLAGKSLTILPAPKTQLHLRHRHRFIILSAVELAKTCGST